MAAARCWLLLLGPACSHAFAVPGLGLQRHQTRLRLQMSQVLSGLKLDVPTEAPCKAGDRVRVLDGLQPLQHVPGHKGGFDASGCEGEVLRIYDEPNLSCTHPVKVQFQEPKPWIGHFTFEEVELVEAGA